MVNRDADEVRQDLFEPGLPNEDRCGASLLSRTRAGAATTLRLEAGIRVHELDLLVSKQHLYRHGIRAVTAEEAVAAEHDQVRLAGIATLAHEVGE